MEKLHNNNINTHNTINIKTNNKLFHIKQLVCWLIRLYVFAMLTLYVYVENCLLTDGLEILKVLNQHVTEKGYDEVSKLLQVFGQQEALEQASEEFLKPAHH